MPEKINVLKSVPYLKVKNLEALILFYTAVLGLLVTE